MPSNSHPAHPSQGTPSLPDDRTQTQQANSNAATSNGCVRPELVGPNGNIELWAVLTPVVADQLFQAGVIHVQLHFLDEKYGEAAWSFKTAYRWMAALLAKKVPQPPLAESPYWLYRDLAWTTPSADSVVLRLEVPANELLLFDRASWNHVLQLNYVPENSADQENFEAELVSMGVTNTATLFTTAFYPLLKAKVVNSWARTLKRAASCPESDLQAATWCLKKEWIVEQKTL